MTDERVLIPKRPRSVHYHRPGCGNINEDTAAELAREDAETLGYRAHACVTNDTDPNPPDGDGRLEVAA